jgi:transcriptional antiterminator RfaH
MQEDIINPIIPDESHTKKSNDALSLKHNWHAIYTRPRHEKKVYEQLQQAKIEAFLPLQTTIRQWSDRKKKVTEPLFRCYVFVFVSSQDYYRAVNINGVVRYVTFEGKAVAIPEKQILLIRNLLSQDIEVDESPVPIERGTRVEIKAGPLIGVFGELVEHAGKKRVIIRIEEINKILLINVPLNFLKLPG